MRTKAEVAIIGGGVMGLSIAYHLAGQGCPDVVVLEKEPLFGTGSTGRCAGGIRHQFSARVNIELSKLSISMLRRFPQETGQELDLVFCGYAFLLDNLADLEQFQENVRLQRTLGVPSEILDPGALGVLAPGINLDGILAGSFCPDDGLADPGGVVQGYFRRSREMGVELLTETPVTAIRTRSGKILAVSTTKGPIYTPTVVIAAGPWSAGVGQMAGIEIPVLPVRRQLAITGPIPDLDRNFPFVIDFSQSLYFHYEGGGILTGMSDPHQPPGFLLEVDEDWRLVHFEKAIRRLPLLQEADLRTEWAGLYEVTPDNQPILGRVSPVEGLFSCTGFSGHGFMHAPACGLLLAEEILEGRTHTIDIDPLRWERFQDRMNTREYNVV